MRNDIKAVNGIGPGTSNVRARVEARHVAKLRESEKRRNDDPKLLAYNTPLIRCRHERD